MAANAASRLSLLALLLTTVGCSSGSSAASGSCAGVLQHLTPAWSYAHGWLTARVADSGRGRALFSHGEFVASMLRHATTPSTAARTVATARQGGALVEMVGAAQVMVAPGTKDRVVIFGNGTTVDIQFFDGLAGAPQVDEAQITRDLVPLLLQ